MLKRSKVIITLIMSLILVMTQFFTIKAENAPEDNQVQIIDSTKDSITFKVTFPLDEIVIKESKVSNYSYTEVSLRGFSSMSKVGAPQLPFLTKVLGVPLNSDVKVTATPGREIRRTLSAPVLPVATENVDLDVNLASVLDWDDANVHYSVSADPKYYESPDMYPTGMAEISNDAVMRSQRLVSIALYPIRFDAAVHELVMVESMTIKVEFSGSLAEGGVTYVSEPSVYEQVFQNDLLNYQQAKSWRKDVSSESLITQTLWNPPNPGWRIEVRETGMYKLTLMELENAGVPIETVDLNTIKMFHLGTEIAIKVLPGDGVVFYGESIESKYTKDNVYWLTYGGDLGLRMEAMDGTPTGVDVAESFPEVEHIEEDHLYRSQVAGDDDLDRYLWSYVNRYGSTVNPKFNYNLNLENRFGGNITLTLMLVGYLQEFSVNPDHRAGILINGTQVSEAAWDGISNIQLEVDVPAELLVPGMNALQITALPTGFSQDLFFIDWFDVGYEKTFASESGQLQFYYNLQGGTKFVVTGFANNFIDIFDISNESSPQWVSDAVIIDAGGSYSAEFSDNSTATKRYFSVDGSGYLTIEAIQADNPSDLATASSGADYLMISHADFLAAAAPLQVQKTAQGFNTVLIDVQDIYDEFGYGITDVNAIREFIAYAYEHSGSAYVLLIGDGHFDPRDNEGFGRTSFIPPYLAKIDPRIGEAAADNRYVSVAGEDSLPDLMLGRLSVNTTAEAQAIISKIINYETNPPDGEWKQQILAVTDFPDPGAHYPLISESLLQAYFPSEPFHADKVYWKWNYTDPAEARAAIQGAFNDGIFLVNYIGHAYYSAWTGDDLFTTSDIGNLQPQNKLPVILPMTCLDGYFVAPNPYSSGWESMGEVITRTEGKGAVASWSPTGWGSVNGHDFLDRGFFKAVYQDGVNRISQATNSGLLNLWASGNNLDLLDTYLLFGDPAMQLPLSVTAVIDEYMAVEDQTLFVTAEQGVLSNDINPENQLLTAVLVDDAFYGSVILNSDGSLQYSPDPNYWGTDSFSYKINDGLTYSNTVLVQITVNPVNDPPVAGNKTVFTSLNTPVEIELTATDDGSGDPINRSRNTTQGTLTFEVLDQPTHGILSGETPFLLYSPSEGFEGADQFTFIANDGEFDSNVATIVIYVGNSNPLFLPFISR